MAKDKWKVPEKALNDTKESRSLGGESLFPAEEHSELSSEEESKLNRDMQKLENRPKKQPESKTARTSGGNFAEDPEISGRASRVGGRPPKSDFANDPNRTLRKPGQGKQTGDNK